MRNTGRRKTARTEKTTKPRRQTPKAGTTPVSRWLVEREVGERIRELKFLYDVANITGRPDIDLNQRYQEIANLLPKAWRYAEIACARIIINGQEFWSGNCQEAAWRQSSEITLRGEKIGSIEVGYLEKKPEQDEGPFLKEERLLLDSVAERLEIITEHRQAEEDLREIQEFSSSLLENAPNPIIVLNSDTSIRYINPAFERLTGFTSAEVAGNKAPFPWWSEAAGGETADSLKKDLEAGHFKKERYHHKKNGDGFWVEINAIAIEHNGELKYHLVNWVDITERKQAEELLRTIAHNSPLGIYILQDNRIQYANPPFQKLTGYSEKGLLGRELLSLVSAADSDVIKSSTLSTIKEDRPYPCEFRIINKAGQIKWVMQTVSSIQYQGREAILGNVMDITERKYLERKVIEYEELSKIKSSLLATVSHELRTPLAIIKGYSTMILDYFSRLDPAEHREYLKAIDHSTDRLTTLVDNLLDSSRMEAGLLKLEKTPTAMSKLIRQAWAEACVRADGHNIAIRLGKNLPVLNIDPKRIRQVLDNLIDNAIKYSPEERQVLITAQRDESSLVVSVADEGLGIPPDELVRVFDRMYRIEQRLSLNADGMGLGLSICRRLVEAHGGRIWAENNPDKGSVFRFTLPIKPPTPREKTVLKEDRATNGVSLF